METKSIPLPPGYPALLPYLAVKDAARAIEFYKTVFNAKEIGRLTTPEGKIGHCELEIAGSRLMLADENPEWGNKSPQTLGGTPVGLCLYVDNVDEVFDRAVKAGAVTDGNMAVKDEFYGDRSGTVLDPFGHRWTIATMIEEVSFEEMQKRFNSMIENA